MAVDVSGFRLEVPIEKTGNYATSENGQSLALRSKMPSVSVAYADSTVV